MIMPTMTHHLGAITEIGIDLHLGQKPKLGGGVRRRFTHLYIYFVGTLYIHVLLSFFSLLFLFLFLLSKTQKDQKYFHCLSLFASLVF
jgi:hypothetical protein